MTKENKSKATARVNVELEITLPSIWGCDCTVSQVETQATREALDMLTKAIGAMPAVRVVKSRGCYVILRSGDEP